MYDVQCTSCTCTIYNVQCTLCNNPNVKDVVYCTIYDVKCTMYMYNVPLHLHGTYCTLIYTIDCTLHDVKYTLYSVTYTLNRIYIYIDMSRRSIPFMTHDVPHLQRMSHRKANIIISVFFILHSRSR